VFYSAFFEGDSVAAEKSNSNLTQGDMVPIYRRKSTMKESFDIVHNVIYYLYTTRITFSTVVPEDPPASGSRSPCVCDAEDIYALAHRLDLPDLQDKALKFPQWSCNIHNITDRVFSERTSLYEDVGHTYDEYFRANCYNLWETPEFKNYISLLEQSEDIMEVTLVFSKFRELIMEY
jgi:hypothetical protein